MVREKKFNVDETPVQKYCNISEKSYLKNVCLISLLN